MTQRRQIGLLVLLAGVAGLLVALLVATQPAPQEPESKGETFEGTEPSAIQPASSPLFASAPGRQGGMELPPPAVEDTHPEGGTISGWVVTSRGEYLPGAQVGASSEEGSAFASTDADGRFELSGLPSEQMNVFATAAGYAADHAYRIPAGTTDLMLVVDEPAKIKGSVQASELPHLFVRLCHHSEEFQKELCIKSEYSSPPAASYELTRLPSGEFDLVFVSEDRELRRQRVQLEPGKELVVPQVTL